MTFIILSLISLLSATCYGAVDLEALKIKAAEYAQNATPCFGSVVFYKKEEQYENTPQVLFPQRLKDGETRQVLLPRILFEVTPDDIQQNLAYQYDIKRKVVMENILETMSQETVALDDMIPYFKISGFDPESKKALREALSTNNIENVVQSIKQCVYKHAWPENDKKAEKELEILIEESTQWIHNSCSVLKIAICMGQYDIAIDLALKNKESLNDVAYKGVPYIIAKPIHHFIPDFLRFLLDQEPNPEHAWKATTDSTPSILYIAGLEGNFKAMQILEEEYNMQDPVLLSPKKAQFNEVIDGGILLNRKNATQEANTAFQALLVAHIHTQEYGAQTVIIPAEKVNLHPDLTLLEAVHNKDRSLISYILKRWGGIGITTSKMNYYFALIYAFHTEQFDIVELFKEHGLTLNDLYENRIINEDLGENPRKLYVLQGTPLLLKENENKK